MTRRRWRAGLATAAVTAATLAAPGATGAALAADDDVLFVVADTDGDRDGAVYRTGPTLAAPQRIVGGPGVHVELVEASPVGEAIAYVRHTATASELYLDNREGTAPRRLHAARSVGDTYRDVPRSVSFSPDGRHVVVTAVDYTTDAQGRLQVLGTSLLRIAVDGTGAQELAGTAGLQDAAYHPSDPSQLVAVRTSGDREVVRVTLSGTTAATTPVPGTSSATQPRLNPSGTALAYVAQGLDLVVSLPDGTGARRLAGGEAASPSWLDDDSVLYVSAPAVDGAPPADVHRYDFFGTPVSGVVTQVTNTPGVDEWALSSPRPADPAPLPPGALTITLRGPNPVVGYLPPVDADLAAVVVRRLPGTVAPASPEDGTLVARTTSPARRAVTDRVTVGETYTYALWAQDASGQWSAPVTRTMRALRVPTLTAPAVASQAGSTAPFRVAWGGGADTYKVQWAVKTKATSWRLGAWRDWLPRTTGTTTRFGLSNRPAQAAPGQTYYVRVAARDAYGNVSAFRRTSTVVPLNEAAAARSGAWALERGSSFWLGTQRTSTRAGAALTVRVTGSTVRILGEKCRACGTFAVYVDGAYRGTFSSYAPSTRRKVVLATLAAPGIKQRTVRVVNLGTRGRPAVKVDGFVVVR